MGSGDKALPHGRLFFDIPVDDFFQEGLQPGGDPVLLELVDPPKLMAVLDKIIGPDLALAGVQPRTVPPETEGGYTTWHRKAPCLRGQDSAFAMRCHCLRG